MLDFRSHEPPPDSSGRSSQRRLIYLVGGLLIVVYCMWQAKDPRNWRWIETLNQPKVAEVDTTAPADARGAHGKAAETDAVIAIRGSRPATRPDVGKPLPERVRAELMASIEDDGRSVPVGILPTEGDAFYHLLEVLRDATPDDLAAAGLTAEKVSFLQLWNQSSAYRGRYVTLAGRIRGVFQKTMPPNEFDISSYHEVWIVPEGSSNLVVVYALELPADFPRGSPLNEPASVAGFSFRRWWYMAGDAKRPETHQGRLAPMLLARTVSTNSAATTPANARQADTNTPGFELFLYIAAGAIAGLGLLAFFLRRSNREASLPEYIRSRRRQDADDDSDEIELHFPKFDNIVDGGKVDIPSALEQLRHGTDQNPKTP